MVQIPYQHFKRINIKNFINFIYYFLYYHLKLLQNNNILLLICNKNGNCKQNTT
ncbi:hypothetical protein B4119_0200 [Parageobacillus caldoxylosilyticus]|uniref:Uncharacterized protein n=1 Tax=Saccharococcus caldoxylosilyticus TaxID=81408 RepID=A0A150KX05_9BACL|nr:hypothetical protein B4119_0200 [Parageobacillus caldoxylosilyticus]